MTPYDELARLELSMSSEIDGTNGADRTLTTEDGLLPNRVL